MTSEFDCAIGCPQMVRMDRGTENGQVAQYQIAFRMSHSDDLAAEKSVKYGSSPFNLVRSCVYV